MTILVMVGGNANKRLVVWLNRPSTRQCFAGAGTTQDVLRGTFCCVCVAFVLHLQRFRTVVRVER